MIGDNIKAARGVKGLTQGQLAERLGKLMGRTVLQLEISRWETGKRQPGAASITLLEKALGQSLGERPQPRLKKQRKQSAAAHQQEIQEALSGLPPLDGLAGADMTERLYQSVHAEWSEHAAAHEAGDRSPEHAARYHALSIQKWILAIATGRWDRVIADRSPRCDSGDPTLQAALDQVSEARLMQIRT